MFQFSICNNLEIYVYNNFKQIKNKGVCLNVLVLLLMQTISQIYYQGCFVIVGIITTFFNLEMSCNHGTLLYILLIALISWSWVQIIHG